MQVPYPDGNLILLVMLVLKVVLADDMPKVLVWGPGLHSRIVLPVRYFFIQVQNKYGENITQSLGEKAFDVTLDQPNGNRVRAWRQVLDRNDGSYIIRFRMYESHSDLSINVLYNGNHIGDSPYKLKGMTYHEKCYCPIKSTKNWLKDLKCEENYHQIDEDLSQFNQIDMSQVSKAAVSRYSNAGQHSLCHYKIINNQIYRKTYGEHVGFKMFTDAVFLSITRKVKLPDVEFFINLGDWPLVKKGKKSDLLPIFSWCGSDDSHDIVMPTYDITEATLEMMGRISLDIFSTQANSDPKWEDKIEKGFWRGRDSRQERLDLVMMSRKNPDLINASLTNMFFFPKDEGKYGKIVKAISFFDFFKYKYQINIDGTVAAYRLPYLLTGSSVVFKQDSPYYEHFYHQLKPNVHYVPFKRDLSDLLEKIRWAKENDENVKNIAKNANNFVRENLNPKDIYCYHVKLFDKYSKLLRFKPKLEDGFELVQQPTDIDSSCDCKRKEKKKKDEL
ncbi:protein O-glucosyltransferase 2 [Patella vulgata]|uniref:protein O-glucosyltransferase 2 n=1 Tax=Patella vulgata TaxID=6465 RepID=UPI00217FBA20|nr:protein O-glucosyltransferase 2 [Patella vulgata]